MQMDATKLIQNVCVVLVLVEENQKITRKYKDIRKKITEFHSLLYALLLCALIKIFLCLKYFFAIFVLQVCIT